MARWSDCLFSIALSLLSEAFPSKQFGGGYYRFASQLTIAVALAGEFLPADLLQSWQVVTHHVPQHVVGNVLVFMVQHIANGRLRFVKSAQCQFLSLSQRVATCGTVRGFWLSL